MSNGKECIVIVMTKVNEITKRSILREKRIQKDIKKMGDKLF